MNKNSLEAYSKVDLTKSERETVELLAKYGPASQAELIAECCKNEPRFQAMEDAERVKAGQNLYARLHGLKKQGFAIITGQTTDPWTSNTVDIYALNPEPKVLPAEAKRVSRKVLVERIEDLVAKLEGMGDAGVSASGVAKMLKRALA